MNYSYKLENISFSYGGRKIIDDLTLEIPQGEICAVIGPNGSGKTTLLHLLLGWLKPDSGRILIGDRQLESLGSAERGRTVSLLPQTENLSFDYTVQEYVLLGRAPHLQPLQQPGRIDYKAVKAALERVSGSYIEKQKIPTLSGGEARTMLMARSLAQEPGILLLDEPSNHLDPSRRRHMLDIIKTFKDENRTVILTTHSPESAADIADSLVMMPQKGNIEFGSLHELFTEEKLSELYGIAVRIHRIDASTVAVKY